MSEFVIQHLAQWPAHGKGSIYSGEDQHFKIVFSLPMNKTILQAPGFQHSTTPFQLHHFVYAVHVSVIKLQNIHVYSKIWFSISSSWRAKYLKEPCELLTRSAVGSFLCLLPSLTIVLQIQLPFLPMSQHPPPERLDSWSGVSKQGAGTHPWDCVCVARPLDHSEPQGLITLSLRGWRTGSGWIVASFSWFQLQKHLMITGCMQKSPSPSSPAITICCKFSVLCVHKLVNPSPSTCLAV